METKILTIPAEEFRDNAAIDVSGLIQTGFKKEMIYLSWSTVMYFMKTTYPTLEFELLKTDEDDVIHLDMNESVFLKGYLWNTVTGEKTIDYRYPVMDNKYNSIKLADIDSRAINDNAQRFYVRTVAMVTGYGFRLFSQDTDPKTKKLIYRKLKTYASEYQKIDKDYTLDVSEYAHIDRLRAEGEWLKTRLGKN